MPPYLVLHRPVAAAAPVIFEVALCRLQHGSWSTQHPGKGLKNAFNPKLASRGYHNTVLLAFKAYTKKPSLLHPSGAQTVRSPSTGTRGEKEGVSQPLVLSHPSAPPRFLVARSKMKGFQAFLALFQKEKPSKYHSSTSTGWQHPEGRRRGLHGGLRLPRGVGLDPFCSRVTTKIYPAPNRRGGQGKALHPLNTPAEVTLWHKARAARDGEEALGGLRLLRGACAHGTGDDPTPNLSAEARSRQHHPNAPQACPSSCFKSVPRSPWAP